MSQLPRIADSIDMVDGLTKEGSDLDMVEDRSELPSRTAVPLLLPCQLYRNVRAVASSLLSLCQRYNTDMHNRTKSIFVSAPAPLAAFNSLNYPLLKP
jgi:hypothetical protein